MLSLYFYIAFYKYFTVNNLTNLGRGMKHPCNIKNKTNEEKNTSP